MIHIVILLLLLSLHSTLHNACIAERLRFDRFDEQLILRPLIDGKIYTHFQFTTTTTFNASNDAGYKHFHLFPRAVGQAMHRFDVEEFHLSFTQGRWHYERWGTPHCPAPVGAELYTWFNNNSNNNTNTNTSVDQRWKGLVNALSGTFCASLNFLDTTVSSHATGSVSGSEAHGPLFRYGTLSREIVCTENLTPFKSLMPSRGKTGIGMLLNPLRLYSHYHSMSVHVRTLRHDNSDLVTWEMVQTVSAIYDPTISRDRRDFVSWSLLSLFNKSILFDNPLATQSRVLVEIPHQLDQYADKKNALRSKPLASVTPVVHKVIETTSDPAIARVHVVDLKQIDFKAAGAAAAGGVNVGFVWSQDDIPIPTEHNEPLTPITAHRYQTGYGQFEGGLRLSINNNADRHIAVRYYDAIPWYFRIYFHTMKIALNGVQLDIHKDFDYFRISPATERGAPSVIEFSLVMPAHGTLSMFMAFDKVFLRYTEHPPDANRGFDLSSSFVTYSIANTSSHTDIMGFEWDPVRHHADRHITPSVIRYYTESLLITLPTPDFSMPYNVITFTSTVIALFFGSLFNVLVRRFKEEEEEEPPKPVTTAVAAGAKRLLDFIDDNNNNSIEAEREQQQQSANGDIRQEPLKEAAEINNTQITDGEHSQLRHRK